MWSTGSRAPGVQQLQHMGSVVAAPRLQSTGSIAVVPGLSCSVGSCGIFPDGGLNLCLLHWQADSLPLSHQGIYTYFAGQKNISRDWAMSEGHQFAISSLNSTPSFWGGFTQRVQADSTWCRRRAEVWCLNHGQVFFPLCFVLNSHNFHQFKDLLKLVVIGHISGTKNCAECLKLPES